MALEPVPPKSSDCPPGPRPHGPSLQGQVLPGEPPPSRSRGQGSVVGEPFPPIVVLETQALSELEPK